MSYTKDDIKAIIEAQGIDNLTAKTVRVKLEEKLGQPCFLALLKRIRAEHPRQPADVSTHLFLHDPRHFHIWQTVAHRFHYTDFVQNRLDAWDVAAVRAVSADTVLVHGKLRRDVK